MSKKSRKRNRRILKALAVGLGTAALMRGRGTPAAANVDSGRSGDSSSALARVKANTPVTGTEYPGANEAVVDTSKGNWKGYGHPIIRGNVKRKKAFEDKMTTPGMGTAVAPPSILNPYNRFANKQKLRTYKSGGRVKLAKRGLGRAFTKSKK